MVVGYLLPSIIIVSLELLFINKRKSKGFLIVIVIDIITLIFLRNIPLIAVLILILQQTKKSRVYFYKEIDYSK